MGSGGEASLRFEIRRDLRYAIRQLRQHPGFTLAAVLTLTIAIGLNSAVFSVVNALLFRPLPVAAPEELVSIFSSEPGDFMARSPLSAFDLEQIEADVDGFSEVLAYTYTPLAVEHGDENRLVLGVRATRDAFSVLGVEAALGRTFSVSNSESRGAGDLREVVLSHRAWQRWFGADSEVVGTALRVGGQPATVVGVAPEDFFGLARGVTPELWMPLPSTDASSQDRELRSLWVIGRLTDGPVGARAGDGAVAAELGALSERLAQTYPGTHRQRQFVALPADSVRILPGVDATLSSASVVVLAMVGLVLLIASANVANLLLARAFDRRREIATRLALGAGPSAIVRQLLTESLLLASLGGVGGLLLAQGANFALGRLRLPLPVETAFGLAIDGRVLTYTMAASLVAALAFGLAPALTAARTRLNSHLRAGTAGGGRTGRLGGALVVGQVALSLLLLVAAGLMVRSLSNASTVDPGFDPEGVAVVTFASRVPSDERAGFDRRLLERVRGLPEVRAAALASHLPLTVEIRFDQVALEGQEPVDGWPSVDSARVGPGYFEALRVPILQGRGFEAHDDAGAPEVAVVNRSFAERFGGAGQILGRRLRIAGHDDLPQVVGIVADGKYRTLGEEGRPFLYRSLSQLRGHWSGRTGEITTGSETLLVRTRGEPSAVLAELRQILRELDPRIAVARLETLPETLRWTLFLPRAAAVLFGLFGILGMALAAVGLAGVLSYAVRRRRREIGIRLALGAGRGQILGLVLRRGVALTAVGILLGLGLALATTRALSAALYGVGATDLPTLVGVALFLISVALFAAWLPARRAACVDPAISLRSE